MMTFDQPTRHAPGSRTLPVVSSSTRCTQITNHLSPGSTTHAYHGMDARVAWNYIDKAINTQHIMDILQYHTNAYIGPRPGDAWHPLEARSARHTL